MNNILDKSLDSQFDKIENLTWFPWVGKGYKCAKRKLLVVGESHYLNEDSDENNEKRRELLIRDKEHTRNCLYEVLINKSWSSKTYSNIMEALCDRGILSDNKTALSEIAYYNFIQRQMDYSKETKERPNINDYKIAWKCFLHIIDILQPTDCIFVGVESVTLFEEIMDKYGVQYTGIDVLEKLNDAYPKKTSIRLDSKNNINIIFIKHSSCYFSPGKWHDFLKQQIPEAIEWLNRV